MEDMGLKQEGRVEAGDERCPGPPSRASSWVETGGSTLSSYCTMVMLETLVILIVFCLRNGITRGYA